MWLQANFGKGKSCENCGVKGKFFIGKKRKRWSIEWALKKGFQYNRDRKSWLNLCHRCHVIYDKPWEKRAKDKLGRFTKSTNQNQKQKYEQSIGTNSKGV